MKSTLGKPSSVTTATKLLYLTLAINIVRILLDLGRILETTFSIITIVVSILTIAAMAFLVRMTDQGRNWTRITFLVLFILGLPLSVLPLLQSLPHLSASEILGLAQVIIQATALCLLFGRNSKPWFRPA